MAVFWASEKAAKDAKAAAALIAPLIITGIKDSMAVVDRDNEENAAWPAPTNITHVNHPICQMHAFANLEQEFDADEVQDGQLPAWVIIASPFLDDGQLSC